MENEFTNLVSNLQNRRGLLKSGTGRDRFAKFLKNFQLEKKLDPKKVILVAGTNGKGTTAFFLKQLLVSQGYEVGLFSSPHLICTTERIQINNQAISQNDFVSIYNEFLPQIDEATHFEALALLAYRYFLNHKVDFAIFEVGIGGLLDATNAIDHDYSIITKLGMDHESILGNSLEAIAEQKLGIVRPHTTTVYQSVPGEILQKHICEKKGIWISTLPHNFEKNQGSLNYTLQILDQEIPLAMIGERAIENAALSITALKALGLPTTNLESLKRAVWPGRMEEFVVSGFRGKVFLSGDHNLQGVKSLLKILRDFPEESIYFFLAFGKDKNANEMLEEFLGHPNSKVYLGELRESSFLKVNYRQYLLDKVVWCGVDIKGKIRELVGSNLPDSHWIVVSGSLYLVGDIRRYLLE